LHWSPVVLFWLLIKVNVDRSRYIVFDDLRPDLSAYDVPFMKTPHIQRLADTGLTFERAYCQEAVCSPSRNSFTTGRRPNSTKVWNFINRA
jgi:iduronate 2-sulfatase